MDATQQSEELTAAQALELLGGVRFGRIVFTSRAMPAVKPVRHVLADGQIVIAIGPELVLGPSPAANGVTGDTIVAYEADQLDASGCSGWSVVVVGRARAVTGKAQESRYRQLLPAVTVPDQLIAISPDVVTGLRLVGNGEPVGAPH
ncbi:MAG TPA: pyridoxamine 5'-phosphate oxidase family protein [Streptosporangiaceae bacterium]|nr:pyridoxamine 5'-phosphate oxidase family protein [Streptosporangiaceae bacterium]